MNDPTSRADGKSALSNRAWYVAAAIICLTLIAGNWDLVSGRALPQWDAADFFGPGFSLVADSIKAGRLVLWNPWVGAGNPDFAEPELGTTSPILLLVGFLSPNPTTGFVFYWLLIWLGAGIGMLFLARSLGAPAWGATIISLAFISSGLFTGHAEHTSSLYSTAFIPWILWRFDRALNDGRYWFAVQSGALYGLSALGGYPQFTILTPILLALWAVGRTCFDQRLDRNRILRAAAMLSLMVFLGAAIFSPSYSGILESTRGYSDRIGPRPRGESIGSNLLTAGALSTFANPYLALLNFPPKQIWPRSDISMTSIYVCPALIVFALFGWRRLSGWRWWLGGVMLLFLACCVGDQLPIRGWVYDLVPPTRYFRNASLFRADVIVLLSAVAAMGLADFRSAAARPRERLFLTGLSICVTTASIISFATVVSSHPAYSDGFAIAHISYFSLGLFELAVTGAGIVALPLLFQFNVISLRLLGRLLVVTALFDTVDNFRVSRPIMYTPVTLPWWKEVNAGHIKSVDLGRGGLARQLTAPPSVATYPNNRNVPLRVPTFDSYVPLANRFHEQFVKDNVLAGMAIGSKRFWFATGPAWLPPSNSVFDLFQTKVHEMHKPVLILHAEQEMRSMGLRSDAADTAVKADAVTNRAICSPAEISNLSYGPNLLVFRFDSQAAGWLLVTDRWAPDWRVTINGVHQKIMGANFIFRGIHVNKGENLIQFRYRPSFFVPLLAMSWGTLLLIAVSQAGRFPLTRR